ncbi:MAG: maleylpyruvate isomerase N-terminal domain-containing protein [Actinomycetota bacterium]|nr:maleylpyruvate isomerase N-terminal domain-containing protein [Actinomycetota bacterium]
MVVATIPIDGDLALARAELATQRLVALLRGVVDPDKVAIGEWSIAQLSTHLADVYERYPTLVRGEPSPIESAEGLAPYSAAVVAANPDPDLRSLAARIDVGIAEYAAGVQEAGHDRPVKFHAGIEMPVAALSCMALGEAVVHGRDIALAEGRPWTIDRDDAALVIKGVAHAIPAFLTQAGRASGDSFRLSLRGSDPLTLRFGGGRLEVTAVDEDPVDCRISADPVAFLLLSYGRIGQLRPIATGKVVALGRKPWLGLRFKQLLMSP